MDLSTHDGVRDAATQILTRHDRVDALLHTTGVFTSRESRTADGLHPFFAVNYLSRYHLTQLLLPALRRAQRPVVIMMTAAVAPTDDADYTRFPDFAPFDFGHDRKPIQLANHRHRGRERQMNDVSERIAPPQSQCLGEQFLSCAAAPGLEIPAAFLGQPLETYGVDRFGGNVQPVSRCPRAQHRRFGQRPP